MGLILSTSVVYGPLVPGVVVYMVCLKPLCFSFQLGLKINQFLPLDYKLCILLVPPSILPGMSLLGSPAGRDVTLDCIVESYPAAFIVWSIEGRSILKSFP